MKYDFAAAANLDKALTATLKALQDLASKRESLRNSDLGDPAAKPYYLWQGKLRDDFEHDFQQQKAALQRLIDQVTTAQKQVTQATDAARRA